MRPETIEVRQSEEQQLVNQLKEIQAKEDGCKWEFGKYAAQWHEAYSRGRSDAALAEMVGVSRQRVNERRLVWERFGQSCRLSGNLTWTHFRVALDWDDAEDWLKLADENGLSVSKMQLDRSGFHYTEVESEDNKSEDDYESYDAEDDEDDEDEGDEEDQESDVSDDVACDEEGETAYWQIIEDEPRKTWYTVAEYEQLTEDDIERECTTPSKVTFNKQDNASIEWAQWSWNPVTGCKHDCPYCYARDIAARFYPQQFEPSIYFGRLWAPANTSVPEKAKDNIAFKNVFTCSMADLFGRWVPLEWIESVMETVADNPQWNFLFLTKFPQRIAEVQPVPDNAWMGTTVDCQSRVANAEKAFAKIKGGIRWLSVEPMLTPLRFKSLHHFDWVVMGGASSSTQTPEWKPPFEWIVDLHEQAREAGCAIYQKENLGIDDAIRLREFPWQRPDEAGLPEQLKYLDIE